MLKMSLLKSFLINYFLFTMHAYKNIQFIKSNKKN